MNPAPKASLGTSAGGFTTCAGVGDVPNDMDGTIFLGEGKGGVI